MLREGSTWRAIGWDVAGSRLAAIQQDHGPASVAAYLGNPNVHHLKHLVYSSDDFRAMVEAKTKRVASVQPAHRPAKSRSITETG